MSAMGFARRKGRFLAAGELDPLQLGLPRARARELLLASAWRRTAGEALARHVGARKGRGDVLVLSVRDERWAAALGEILPSLAARLAARFPELGLARFKIEGLAGGDLAAEPLPSLADEEPRLAGHAEPPGAAEAGPPRSLEERLVDLARAYLARQKA
jgi:hypothetical protein